MRAKNKKLVIDKHWIIDNVPFRYHDFGYAYTYYKNKSLLSLEAFLRFKVEAYVDDQVNNEIVLYGNNFKLPSIKPIREKEAEDSSYLFLYK